MEAQADSLNPESSNGEVEARAVSPLEELAARVETMLDYRFSNHDLLKEALTHASIADDRKSSNERLEFLGDSVLGLVVCHRLFELFPDYLEGDLTKLKSAMVFKAVSASDTLITPAAPTFDGTDVTIHDTTHVVYRNADTDAVVTNSGSPYTLDEGETMNVHAEAASGYYFDDTEVDDWSFTNNG